MRAALSAALGGLLAAQVREAKAVCLENGMRCGGERGTCCSGVCKRKPGTNKKFCRPAADQGTCTVEQDACTTGLFSCNGDQSCLCWVTPRGASFCGGPGGVCVACERDADCESAPVKGAKCARCPECPSGTVCVQPCPTQV